MKALAIALTLAAVLVVAGPARAEDPKGKGLTPDQLEGSYTIVSGEKNGKPLPREEVEGSLVRFTKDTVVGTDKGKKEIFVARYQLDGSKKPAVISMTSTMKESEGQSTRGLIEREGDTVRLIYALPRGDKMPTGFKTQEGQLMVVLKMNKP